MDTIFALSSGAPPAAIAIVRISGPAAGEALRRLGGKLPPPRRAVVRALRNDGAELLDRALVLWFPGSATATGEDLAELHLHGGRAVVAAVFGALQAVPGCRGAEPGEFTRRAFLNGRLDLAEAEGLADLLAAETEQGRRQALRLAEGGLSRKVEAWRIRLLDLAARAEAALDFGDDEDDVLTDPMLPIDIQALVQDLDDAISAPPAERLRDGFRIVVAGPPNVGKSSLINALAGREVAIAADEPGTTRDLIEVPVRLGDYPVIFIDSAGLRESEHEVERVGISRAEQAIAVADLVLWLGEPQDLPAFAAQTIIVHARNDLPGRQESLAVHDVSLSAHTGQGMYDLRSVIGQLLSTMIAPDDGIALNERQRRIVAAATGRLRDAVAPMLPELVAEHLRATMRHLDRLLGRVGVEDMLNALFARFCVGK